MERTSTTENLFLYFFNETLLSETVLIQKEIDTDPETEEEYEAIKRAMKMFDEVLMAPSRKSVDKILNYAAKTACQ